MQTTWTIAQRAGAAGLITGLGLAGGVLTMVLWPALLVIWPIVFLPLGVTGILAVERISTAQRTAAIATMAGSIAGVVAGAITAATLSAAGQWQPLWSLVGVLAAAPWSLGPFDWFGRTPWPLPLLLPIGMALAGLQAWAYYRWFADPRTDVREALADWVARQQAPLQGKLRLAFLLIVAATLLVGWLGFGTVENAYRRLHVLELRAEWFGLTRGMHALVQEQLVLADELGMAPRVAPMLRIRQLNAEMQAQLDRLSNYSLHPAYVLNPEPVQREAETLSAGVARLRDGLAVTSAQLEQPPGSYPGGPQAYAVDLERALVEERQALDGLLGHFAQQQGRGIPGVMQETSAARQWAELALLVLLGGAVGMALLLQAVLAHVAVRPVAAVVAHLRQMGDSDFTSVLAVPNRDELGELARAVNEVNAQLASAQAQLQNKAASLAEQVATQVAEIERAGQLQRYLPPQLVERVKHGDVLESGKYDRRKVTILFADMAGFTDLSDTIEAEELGDVLNEYFALMSEAVSRHGGTLLDFIGDAVMVVFGAPAASEPARDACHAVELALDIQRQVAAWGESWYARGLDRAPAVRIGVHSGFATVGTFGTSARTEYAAIGRTTNTAARVQAAARPGGILVSWATRALAGPGFRYASRGALQAKGLHAPVEIFEVLPAAASRVPANSMDTP